MRSPYLLLLVPFIHACGDGPTCEDAIAGGGEEVESGIVKYECTDDVVVVTIERSRTDLEIWVMEDPPTTVPTATDKYLDGALLGDGDFRERSQAVIQINGFTFSCQGGGDDCYDEDIPELPTTRVLESTHVIRSSSSVGDDWMLSFGPRSGSSNLSINLTANGGEEPQYRYNAMGSTFAVLNGGACTEGTATKDWTVVGYSDDLVVMVYAPDTNPQDLCSLVGELGVSDAIRMDGGGSAGMHLRQGGQYETIGRSERRIPYRLGVVSLGSNQVLNGDFEQPVLLERNSETPPGVHALSGQQMVELGWSGAVDLYNTAVYNARAGNGNRWTFPDGNSQLVVLRPRDPPEEHIQQELTGAPPNRYCMLHFWHGYVRPPPFACPSESKLRVDFLGSPTSSSEFCSPETTGTGAALQEAWLRFLTPEQGHVTLKFTASDLVAPSACGVLLDNVTVECAQ